MPARTFLLLAALLLGAAVLCLPTPAVRADDGGTATATPVPTVSPTVTPTPLPAAAPGIAITQIDMLRHVGGVFFSTRHIRIGNLVRYVVRYRISGIGKRIPNCQIDITHNGVTFYEDDMWHRKGKNVCYLDGRFHNVVGTLIASFTLRLGTERVSATLPFRVKLPKF